MQQGMASRKLKPKFIVFVFIVAIIVLGSLLAYCIAIPVSLQCSRIEWGVISDYGLDSFFNEYQQLKSRGQSGDNQVFGELPAVQEAAAEEYIRIWYYVDLSSHKLGSLMECSLVFSEVDNSEHRFLFSPSPAFSATVSPLGKHVLSRSVYVYRGGMTDEELSELLQSVRLSVYYQYNDELKVLEISASNGVVEYTSFD